MTGHIHLIRARRHSWQRPHAARWKCAVVRPAARSGSLLLGSCGNTVIMILSLVLILSSIEVNFNSIQVRGISRGGERCLVVSDGLFPSSADTAQAFHTWTLLPPARSVRSRAADNVDYALRWHHPAERRLRLWTLPHSDRRVLRS